MSDKSNSNKSSREKRGERGNAKKKDPRFYVVVSVGIVIIALLVTVIVVLLTREPTVVQLPPEVQLIEGPGIGGYVREPGGRGFVVTPENVDEVRAALEERRLSPEDRYFEFSIVPNWTFPTSRTPSPDALVRNVARNSRTVFFDVYIDGHGVVYASPFMPLGSQHSGFALEADLDAGVYRAVVTHFLVDDELEILTDVSVAVTITIEN